MSTVCRRAARDDERCGGEAQLHRLVALGDGDRFVDRGGPPFDQVGAAIEVVAQGTRCGGSSLTQDKMVELGHDQRGAGFALSRSGTGISCMSSRERAMQRGQ
jgi:hypothetical protein